MYNQKSEAWKVSRLRKVLSRHVLGKLKADTKKQVELTKLFINL